MRLASRLGIRRNGNLFRGNGILERRPRGDLHITPPAPARPRTVDNHLLRKPAKGTLTQLRVQPGRVGFVSTSPPGRLSPGGERWLSTTMKQPIPIRVGLESLSETHRLQRPRPKCRKARTWIVRTLAPTPTLPSRHGNCPGVFCHPGTAIGFRACRLDRGRSGGRRTFRCNTAR